MKNNKNEMESIKLVGEKSPKPIIWVRGRIHGKAKHIVKYEDNNWRSNYTFQRERELQRYTADMYKFMGESLYPIRNQIQHQEAELEQLQSTLEKLQPELSSHPTDTAKQCRERKRLEHKKASLNNRIEAVHYELERLAEVINSTELSVEELLLSKRRLVEGQLAVYFRGARKYLGETAIIDVFEEPTAKNIYELHCKDSKVTSVERSETYA